MTDTRQAGRSDRTNPQMFSFLTTPSGRFLTVVVCAVLILVIAIGSYFLAWSAGGSELRSANLRIVQVQNDNQRLTADNTNLAVEVADLQIQIKTVQAKLAAIMPSENTYVIHPNQSLIVADGRLTIGLIGSPTNETINLNISGKPQSVAAGAIINSALDASTTCQIGVQFFDMFKAVLTATCAATKSK